MGKTIEYVASKPKRKKSSPGMCFSPTKFGPTVEKTSPKKRKRSQRSDTKPTKEDPKDKPVHPLPPELEQARLEIKKQLEDLGMSHIGKMNLCQLFLCLDEKEHTEEDFPRYSSLQEIADLCTRYVKTKNGKIMSREDVSKRMQEWWDSGE